METAIESLPDDKGNNVMYRAKYENGQYIKYKIIDGEYIELERIPPSK